MKSSLRVEDADKSFSGLKALSNVSLTVDRKTIVGLIGPNGSGKTTLINTIGGVLKPDKGRIFLNDREITGLSPDAIARLGVGRTFQTARLFASLTVRENVEAGVMIVRQKNTDKAVDRLLERFGLTKWARMPAGALAYGIQRRLEIARALGRKPGFLMLDEPAAGLNPDESEELFHLIKDLRDDPETGCGVLIVEHDLHLIMRLCDRICALNEGKTIAQGAPEEVRHNPAVVEAYLGRKKDRAQKWLDTI